MNLRNALTIGVAAGLLAALSAHPVSAQTTFASFSEIGTTAKVSYSGGTLSAISIPVTFTYLSTGAFGTPTGGFTSHTGVLSFTASSSSNVTSSVLGGQTYLAQNFTVTDFTFTENGTGKNLLSGHSNSSDLVGVKGALTQTFSSNDPSSTLLFGSDYLPGVSAAHLTADFTWTLNSNIGLTAAGTDFQGFSATISGLFDGTPSSNVPEPGTVALLSSLGVVGSVFGVSRLRRRK